MRFLLRLSAVLVVSAGFVFLGRGWQAAAMSRERLKTELAHERLIRIVESTIDLLSQHNAPDTETSMEPEDLWWLCYNEMHKSLLGFGFVKCEFEPKLAQYIEVIQDFPNSLDKRAEHINKLMSDRTIKVTVMGYESGDEFLLRTKESSRAEGLYTKHQYSPAVVMTFTVTTSIRRDVLWEKLYPQHPWRILRYSRPRYEFLK